jgi:hypothetical protein
MPAIDTHKPFVHRATFRYPPNISLVVRPQPLTHAIKYTAVTICIAAVHGEPKDPKIILCADRRLDQGEWGSSESGKKVVSLGYNWCALMAGTWAMACDAVSVLSDNIRGSSYPTTSPQIFSSVKRSAEQFRLSELCPKDGECTLLVTGFIDNKPVLIHVNITKHESRLLACKGVVAIGEGATVATSILNLRNFGGFNQVEQALYSVYEAKVYSETVTSVGPGTFMMIQFPDVNPQANRTIFKRLDEGALTKLHSLNRKFGLREITGIEEFPADFYLEEPDQFLD